MKNIFVVFILCFCFSLGAQHKIGVRAGLNYSKFNGPLEVNESFAVTGGFHFGINYTYEFTPTFGLRGELLYTQRGTQQKYEGETYYIVNPISSAIATFIDRGQANMELKISNAYFSLPITANYRLSRKFEVFGGASLDFMIGPSGRGKYKFTSNENPETLTFTQSLDYRFGSDVAGQYNTFLNENLQVEIAGDIVTLPRVVGAYYNFTTAERELGDKMNSFDAHLILGTNYYINTGFYVGARVEYGLLDVTNNAVDQSLGELNSEDGYIFRADSDKSFNVAVSFGFKF